MRYKTPKNPFFLSKYLEILNLFYLFFKNLKVSRNFHFKNLLFLLIFILNNCSSDKKYDKSKAVSLLNLNIPVEASIELENISIKIPSQINNNLWSGSSSLLNQRIENIAKTYNSHQVGWWQKKAEIKIDRTWYKNIFYYEDFAKSFVYSPIILNDKIFVLDSSGDLTAFSLNSKKTLWHKRIFDKLWLKNYKVAHLGACHDLLFAVAGVNQIKAVNQIDGKILWSKDLSVVLNSAPICDDKNIYISSSDNKTFALNYKTGDISWIHYGIQKSLAIFGNSQPVLAGDSLILSYSSGEIFAVNKKTGENLWSNDLNSSQNYNSNFFLSDIDATPLVKDNIVYVIGNGGFMKAISLKNGNEIWQLSIASIIDFWLAGDFLFVINNDNKLMAVYKKTGQIKWVVQLPDFKNPKKITSKFNYIGVVMAGDKLLVARQDGEIFFISPFDGKIEKQYSLSKRILHVPVVINNKIYFYGMSRFKTKLIELE
jgi:outer membrane protein assembly factor BamB